MTTLIRSSLLALAVAASLAGCTSGLGGLGGTTPTGTTPGTTPTNTGTTTTTTGTGTTTTNTTPTSTTTTTTTAPNTGPAACTRASASGTPTVGGADLGGYKNFLLPDGWAATYSSESQVDTAIDNLYQSDWPCFQKFYPGASKVYKTNRGIS